MRLVAPPAVTLATMESAMTAPNQARVLLDHLRRVPDATPAKLLAEFKRLLANEAKAKGKAR
jgi:hypothetical protein